MPRNLLRTREDLEELERRTLASYAMLACDSRGRRVAGAAASDAHSVPARSRPHCPFRRLPPARIQDPGLRQSEGDYYRTRLTHTIEAAQITRTVAAALGLNRDLAEAVALAHDLGHTPFGHAGERVLNDLMAPYGGFDHNAQSLRTIDWIEVRYPNFRGLNLSFEVREGIVKHSHFQGTGRGAGIRSRGLPVPRSPDRRPRR